MKYGCDIAKSARVTMVDSDENVIGMILLGDEKE